MSPIAVAVLDLIREININRLTAQVGRDTAADHAALIQARERYDRVRVPAQRRPS